jgi:FtsH-binding integral membrane protein
VQDAPAILAGVGPTVRRAAAPWAWLAADLVCVLAFAYGGKSTHEAADSDWVVLAIAWPFAVGAVLAHGGLAHRRRTARALREGALVVGVTYVVGMLLRVLAGRGIAPGFLVVAAVFLTVTMLGWRIVVRRCCGHTSGMHPAGSHE